jgi:hypothetical protein
MIERTMACLAEAAGECGRAGIVVAAVVATSMLLPLDLQAARSRLPLFSLRAPLTVAPNLPDVSRHALISEAERIWKREGVALEWPTGPADGSASLRVLVIARREAVMKGTRERWPVAELVPQAEQRALAIASIASAERVLDEASAGRQLLMRPESAEYRLGVVLGRAVAHEIGHYLLATATHADHGLMRAAIDAHEFADPAARTFGLDETAGAWLRDWLSARAAGARSARVFNYGPTSRFETK